MNKHKKRAKDDRAKESSAAAPSGQPLPAHSPARRPILLAVSILLFVLWFVFLLVTALRSGS